MFKTVEEAKEHLKKWLKEHGWTGAVRFSMSYGLKNHNGRPAWDFDLIDPYGVYFVYNDNGEVEDNYGTVVKK